MKCPRCNLEQLAVMDSRPHEWGIKRKRKCLNCGFIMPTIEIYELTDEALKSLNRSKILARHKNQKGN